MGYRILFMGTPDFAVPCLQALLASDHQVVAVVTQPDRPKGRGKKLAAPPVKEEAKAHGIPVLQPTAIKTEAFREELRSFKADIFVVVAYGRILPTAILELPQHGCINVHGSLLPKYRGAAPIQWTVLNGDTQAGVTVMQMNEGMDTGDILLSSHIDVLASDTAGSLFDKLALLGANSLLETLTGLQQGTIQPQEQDHGMATTAPPLRKDMGNIDWNQSAQQINNLIRGLDPWPCGYSFLDGKRCKLFSPQTVHRNCPEQPGTILVTDNQGILVATGSEALLLQEIQPEGKKRMTVADFLRGYKLQPGSQFSQQ